MPMTATQSSSAADPHRPRFHYTAPTHWINDPNGLCFHGGRYHVYFQHNPNASHWGDMHWGHASSADLVTWRDEPIALAPMPGGFDGGGCFSGSFAVVSGQPTLYYTGYTAERQVQCVATSTDLQAWVQQPERTLIDPPPGVEGHDFRDPYVFQHDGGWCMVVGASLHHERGQCLLYRSDDGVQWRYCGPLFTAPDLSTGVMWECPNFFPLGDRWVLTISRWPLLGAHAWVGRFEGDRFTPEWDGVMDPDGGAFAHLTFTAPDGRALQWAWMCEQREQALVDADGWSGALTVPRELTLDAQGRLNQRPVAEIARLREAPVDITATGAATGVRHTFSGAFLDIEATFAQPGRDKLGLTVRAAPDGSEATRIVYWRDARRLSIERSRSSLDPSARRQDVHAALYLADDEPLQLRVLVDASVLEVYANGRLCLSTRIYPTRADSVQAHVFSDAAVDVAVQAWAMGAAVPAQRPPLALAAALNASAESRGADAAA